jgi:hypothetical protein
MAKLKSLARFVPALAIPLFAPADKPLRIGSPRHAHGNRMGRSPDGWCLVPDSDRVG